MFINIFSVTTVSLSTLNIPSVIYPRQKRESLKIFQFPQRHKNFWPHIKNKIDIVYLDNNWKIQIINETHSTFLLLKYSKRNLQYENLDISMRKNHGSITLSFFVIILLFRATEWNDPPVWKIFISGAALSWTNSLLLCSIPLLRYFTIKGKN